jgi:excinuclease ABC subunit C
LSEELANKLKELPKTPGVYFHKAASGDIIYVGKAAEAATGCNSFYLSKRQDIKFLYECERLKCAEKICGVGRGGCA